MKTSNKVKSLIVAPIFFLSTSALADWPVAIVDNLAAHQSQFSVAMDVLGNDIGSGLKITAVNSWSENGARISINDGVSLTYIPPIDYVGEDGFWYVIQDSQGRTNAARVSVNVLSSDTALPALQDDKSRTLQNTSVKINVLENDLFSSGGLVGSTQNTGFLSSSDEQSINGGAIEIIRPPASKITKLVYTPPAGFIGTDTFQYTAQDNLSGILGTSPQTATVTVDVQSESDTEIVYPTGEPDSINIACKSDISCDTTVINVLTNDKGEDLSLSLNSFYSLRSGTVSVVERSVGQSSLTYNPANNFTGEDTVWYIIEDSLGRQNWSVLNITVSRPGY